MEELSIEEKAKAYDEAKIRISKAYNNNRCTIGFMNEIFPELAESEDERIRKYLKRVFGEWSYDDLFEKGFKKEDILAWLEKQGEQKHAEWSEADKRNINELLYLVEAKYLNSEEPHDRLINFLESLKERVQPKQKWSEEDYNEIETIACHLDNINNEGMAEVLRSIRDKYYLQSTWKPSKEQIMGIDCAIKTLRHQLNVGDKRLNSLYDDLKKLGEE